MSDELSDLRLFLKIVAAGSLSETARRLNTSLTAMSRRLAQMEERLGARLVDRGSRRFTLTEEGMLLHERGLRIIADLDEVEAEVGAKVRTPRGRLRISAPLEIGRRRIAPVVAEFTRLHPDIAAELLLTDGTPDLSGDDLDVTVQVDLPTDGNVVARRIFASRRVVCASPGYISSHGRPERPEDLTRHSCILLLRGGDLYDRWRFLRDGEAGEIVVIGALTTDSAEVVHNWILGGYGIGLKAHWDVKSDLAEGRIVEVLAPYACDTIDLYATYATRTHLPLRIRMFIDFLVAALQRDVGEQ